MVSGTASGATGGAYSYLTGKGPHSVGGFLRATTISAATGAVTGGAGGAFGHGASTLGLKLLPRHQATPPSGLPTEAHGLMGNPGDEVVIGRLPDTAVARDWPGHVVLQTDDWTPQLNRDFIQAAIDYQRPVYIGSPIEGNMIQEAGEYAGRPTIFAEELEQLREAGFTPDGDYLLPPRS